MDPVLSYVKSLKCVNLNDTNILIQKFQYISSEAKTFQFLVIISSMLVSKLNSLVSVLYKS